MEILKVIILGAIQGLTEFLPVSSSGHLVIFKHIFGVRTPGASFEVAVHLGTLLPVLIVFRREIGAILADIPRGVGTMLSRRSLTQSFSAHPSFKLAWLIVVATVPAGLAGVLLEETFERMFNSILAVGFALEATAVIIAASGFLRFRGFEGGGISFPSALCIGVAQALAITPGISRSGATISLAVMLGIAPVEAARFSFLIAIPAILGAGLIQAAKLDPGAMPLEHIFAAVTASAVVGYVALKLLLRTIRTGNFNKFAVYCAAVGVFAICWGLLVG